MRQTNLLDKGFHIRAFRRVSVHCLMYFSAGDVYGTGTVWNLSLGGWRGDSDRRLEPGMVLTLFVMLPDSDHTIVVDEAMVSWSRGHEFGLAIRHIQPQDAARLKRWITARV